MPTTSDHRSSSLVYNRGGRAYWCGAQRDATGAMRVTRIDSRTWEIKPEALATTKSKEDA